MIKVAVVKKQNLDETDKKVLRCFFVRGAKVDYDWHVTYQPTYLGTDENKL